MYITTADFYIIATCTETFELQLNVLYGVPLTTMSKGIDESDQQLQEFKKRREVTTKLTEQPRSDERLELKRNEACIASDTTFRLPAEDSTLTVTYDYIRIARPDTGIP